MNEKHYDQHMLLIDTLYKYECKLYGVKYALKSYYSRLNELVDLFDVKNILSI